MTAVVVHLDHGKDPASWGERHARGEVPDRSPYGYHHAAGAGVELSFTTDRPEGRLGSLGRRALGRFLGFDVVHAWTNRDALRAADWVWTHTEREHLAVAAVLGRSSTPKLLAQSLWLPGDWYRLPSWKRALYRRLLRRATVHTFHARANASLAESLGWGGTAVVPFGVSADDFPVREPRRDFHDPVRVLSLGNDRHRDWATLHRAAAMAAGRWEVRVAAAAAAEVPPGPAANTTIVQPASRCEVQALYEWCDVVVVPVMPNLHVSGMTVVLEATRSGRPVVIGDTTAMREQLDRSQLVYVPVRSPAALVDAVAVLAADPDAAADRVRAAQARLVRDGRTSADFARRHAALSVPGGKPARTGAKDPDTHRNLVRSSP